jgi:hypothetical protein
MGSIKTRMELSLSLSRARCVSVCLLVATEMGRRASLSLSIYLVWVPSTNPALVILQIWKHNSKAQLCMPKRFNLHLFAPTYHTTNKELIMLTVFLPSLNKEHSEKYSVSIADQASSGNSSSFRFMGLRTTKWFAAARRHCHLWRALNRCREVRTGSLMARTLSLSLSSWSAEVEIKRCREARTAILTTESRQDGRWGWAILTIESRQKLDLSLPLYRILVSWRIHKLGHGWGEKNWNNAWISRASGKNLLTDGWNGFNEKDYVDPTCVPSLLSPLCLFFHSTTDTSGSPLLLL